MQKAQDKSISKNELDELLQWLEDDEAAEYMPDICSLLGVEAKEPGVEEKEVDSPDSEVDYSSQWQKLSDKIPEEDVHSDQSEIMPFRKDYRISPVGQWAVAAAVLVLCSVMYADGVRLGHLLPLVPYLESVN